MQPQVNTRKFNIFTGVFGGEMFAKRQRFEGDKLVYADVVLLRQYIANILHVIMLADCRARFSGTKIVYHSYFTQKPSRKCQVYVNFSKRHLFIETFTLTKSAILWWFATSFLRGNQSRQILIKKHLLSSPAGWYRNYC